MTKICFRGISLLVAFAVMLSLGVFSAQAGSNDQKDHKDIVEMAQGDQQCSTFCTAVKAAGLIDTLKSKGPFTVFVPNNDAFAKLPEGQLSALLADKAKLKEVLLFHVVPGKVMAADVASLQSAKTASGKSLKISTDGDAVMIGNSQVIKADIECGNGVIHMIDTVLIP